MHFLQCISLICEKINEKWKSKLNEMGSIALLCAFIFISGFFQDARGEKPEMFPASETLFVLHGGELRIECYSKEAKLQFSFPEAEVTNLRSDHKILQSGNGTYTFLRGPVNGDDAGWYACAEEGIEIDNHFSNINHTHKDIRWIYVYMKDAKYWFTDSLSRILSKTIIVVAGSTAVVPCRPSLPITAVELWQNIEPVRIDGTEVKFDPKIGFIIKKVDFEEGETVVECRTKLDTDHYVLRLSGQRPTMITAGSELTVQEGTELKIECKSETNISFMFPERFSNSSKFEIFANESGVKTFLRRSAVADDTGWYGCAGEGVQNDIPYYSINYTRREISWIYVYVNSTVPITSGLMVYKTYNVPYVIIPCRPTSPGLHVQLISYRNDTSPEPLRNVPFDSKLGFVLRRSPNEGEEFSCTTNESVEYVPKTYNPTSGLIEAWTYKLPPVVDADDKLASENLSIRLTGEDLRLLCEAVDPEAKFISLEWMIPSTVSKDRIQYHMTRADDWVDQSVRFRVKNSMVTIRNISETDSGDYSCFAQILTFRIRKKELMKSDSRHVEVFDKNGGRYMKLGKQGGAMAVTGLKGETVKWVLDLGDFPSAKISWFDVRGHLINVSSDPNGSRHVNLTSRRGSPHLLFTISRAAFKDSGVYVLSADTGNVTAVVNVTVNIQEPPLASVWTSYSHPYTTEESITAKCRSYGHPRPDVKFSFLNLPKFPSRMNSELTDLYDIWTVYTLKNAEEGTIAYYGVRFSVNVSGIVICEACNPVNCSLDEEEILYSVSDEPYFTSTNLNRSEVTVNREIDRHNTSILECYAAGRPYPNVTWFKGSIPLREDSQFKFANDNRELSILFFDDEDSGRYMCRAENEHGKVENYVDIKIQGAPNILRTSFIIAASVLLGVIVISWLTIGKLRIEATKKKRIDSAFNNGALGRLNPELSVVDQAELLPYDLKWEFPRELLTLDEMLGSGAFGIVKKAEAKSIRRGEPVTTVAVKLVRSKASLNFITALTRELKILVYLGKHMNVVNLLGACTKHVSYGELFVIVEYCRFGNLHDYLIRGRADFIDETQANTIETSTSSVDTDGIDITDESPNANDANSTEARGRDTDSTSTSLVDENRTSGEDSGNAQGFRSNYRGDCEDMNLEPIRTRDLVYWSWQVSRGMDYLGKRKVVHGDLAARNILLAENGIVKISDFGLSKALYEEAQYRDQGVDPLPVKWMAPESIRDRVFSYQSDIWSFGIVMWEFFTLAKTPYPGIKCRELYQQLVNGYRMEKPEFATSSLYHTMLNCWESDPSKRPSFIEIAHSFDDSLDEGFKSRYLDMISTYIEINADMFENGSKDYLTPSPSTFDAAASATVYNEIEMDDLPHDASLNSV